MVTSSANSYSEGNLDVVKINSAIKTNFKKFTQNEIENHKLQTPTNELNDLKKLAKVSFQIWFINLFHHNKDPHIVSLR